MLLAAFRGRPVEASLLIESAVKDATDSGEGRSVAFANWAIGVLYNGLGRYEDAVRPAQQASEEWPEQALSAWALVELIEASIRCGKLRVAADAMQQLASATEGSDSEWGRGVEARSRALLSTGKIADGLYREAVQRLSCTQLRPELARAHLLHGEWLRRQNRPKDAREQLRTAYDMFASMGAAAFTDRARRELLATGEKVRKRRDETTHDLTPQEDQIARLAAQGETSRDIAGRLFISANTVDYHLKKIYRKLGVSSRRELRRAFE
jgi:DNA-binding CsgD family transcriptional regulator